MPFSPYADNGGTTLAIAGKDFCIISSDTRLSQDYNILTRDSKKVFKLSNTAVLGTSGMQADTTALLIRLRYALEMYQHKHNKEMSIDALAQLLSVVLYSKRFFPYYVWNVLGGIDSNGKGCVFSYDPVGNYEKEQYSCAGSAGHLLLPFLDSHIGMKHKNTKKELSDKESMNIVLDAFSGAGERDIYTGDFVEGFVVYNGKIEEFRHPLKRD